MPGECLPLKRCLFYCTALWNIQPKYLGLITCCLRILYFLLHTQVFSNCFFSAFLPEMNDTLSENNDTVGQIVRYIMKNEGMLCLFINILAATQTIQEGRVCQG